MNKKFDQASWDKENMARITGKYKKDFVEDFKNACQKLEISQSDVFREAMTKIIEKAKIK